MIRFNFNISLVFFVILSLILSNFIVPQEPQFICNTIGQYYSLEVQKLLPDIEKKLRFVYVVFLTMVCIQMYFLSILIAIELYRND
jgi:hypothetical protein